MDFEEKRNQIRKILGPTLPPELDTDFNLNRWIKSYEGVGLCLSTMQIKFFRTFQLVLKNFKNILKTEKL